MHGQNVSSLTLGDGHMNWLNWFHFLILVAGLLVIVIGCMIDSCVTIPRHYNDLCLIVSFRVSLKWRKYCYRFARVSLA